ncbi:SPOR domain-containing protein [Oxalobacteraceae bacterium OTU3CINTB1]|nr:SPOR domain-containing protein [Oxalobacteraceae bacterium OTU3CINTB1]
MLKFIFWSLLAVNAALFAYGQGYLGHFSGNEREPARLVNQLNAKELTIISAERAGHAPAVASAADGASPPAGGKAAPQPLACVEIGSFILADARRFEARLAPLNLGDRQSRRNLPGTEISSYIVNIPPMGSKEAADKKAAELRGLGVTNFFVMPDNSPMRWAISLGVFKSETAAQNQLAALVKQGVRTARVTPRMSGSKLLAFQFRDVDAELQANLEKIRADFPNTQTHSCK